MRLIRFLKHELAAEMEDWVRDDLLSVNQAESILSRYNVAYGDKRRSAGNMALYALAVLFIGMALFLLLSRNWNQISPVIRLLVMLTGTTAANLAGFYYHRKGSSAARLWYLFGGFWFGASIFLVGQMYHLSEYATDGLWWWSVGLIPVAIAAESVLVMALFMVVSAFWFYHGLFLNVPFWGYGVFLLIQTWFILFRRESTLLYLFALGQWLVFVEVLVSFLIADGNEGLRLSVFHIYFSTALFLLLYGIASSGEKIFSRNEWRLYALSTRLWSVRFAILGFFIFSFSEPWKKLIIAINQTDASFYTMSIVLIFLSSAFVIFYAIKEELETGKALPNIFKNGSVWMALFITTVTCITYLSPDSAGAKDTAELLQLLTNFAAVASGIFLVCRAIDDNSTAGFYGGLVLIGGIALLRYIDLIGDYIGGTILFLVFGFALLACGYLRERSQKNLMLLKGDVE